MLKLPYGIGKRNNQIPETHWEDLGTSYKITKPTIICLGGNGTRGSEQANHICKIAEGLVGLKDKTIENEWPTSEDVDIIGISYGEEYAISSFGKKVTNRSAHLTSKEHQQIFYQLFTPLISNNGQKLSDEDLLKNMSLLTFFSFCQGAHETKAFVTKLEQHMLLQGYSMDLCEQALNQIVSVSYAPMATVPYVKRFDIKSLEDQYFYYGHEYERDTGFYEFTLRGNHLALDKPDDRFPFENGMTLYSSQLADSYYVSSEHNLSIIERNLNNWKLESPSPDGPVYMGENADKASQCMGYVLASSVVCGLNNQLTSSYTPKPEIPDLFNDCNAILFPEQNPYTLKLTPIAEQEDFSK